MPANTPPKFRFYITDTFDGTVKGTNDDKEAAVFATCCDYFVVDTATNTQWQEDGSKEEITPISVAIS